MHDGRGPERGAATHHPRPSLQDRDAAGTPEV